MSDSDRLNQETMVDQGVDSSPPSCKECQKLQNELESYKEKNLELEEINDNLAKQIETLLEDHESQIKQIDTLKAEVAAVNAKEEENKKQSLLSNLGTGLLLTNSLSQSEVVGASTTGSEDLTGSTTGLNLKKLQQDLRVSKKAEQLAKEKLAQTKKTLERTERDFAKHREDAQTRIDQLSNEIQILQKHYDQLQNSINENELDMRSNGSQNNKGSELVKIIEEYSRQNDLKAKEIEQMIAKLDRKAAKMESLKKVKSESEAKNQKLRSTLENVKTFLKLLSNNYMKSIKVQVQTLKEQYQSLNDEFIREIQSLKSQIEPQITKTVMRQSQGLLNQLLSEKERSSKLENAVNSLKAEHETQIQRLRILHDDEIASLKQKSLDKKLKLKEKILTLSEASKNYGNEKTQIKDTLTARITELEKDLQLSNLKLDSEKDKYSIKIQELTKDINQKDQFILDLKQKETSVVQKIEGIEQRHRQEIQSLIEKHESDKLTWLQREADVSGAREADRLKEMREMLETKAKEKDEELQRVKLSFTKAEDELKLLKEEERRRNDATTEIKIQIQDQIKQITLLQEKLNKKQASASERKLHIVDLNSKLNQAESVIKELTYKGQRQDEQMSNIQKHQVESLRIRVEDLQIQLQTKQERIEQLENAVDQLKFYSCDEITVKESQIRELHAKLKSKDDDFQSLEKLNLTKEAEIKYLNQQLLELQDLNQTLRLQSSQQDKIVKNLEEELKNLQIEMQSKAVVQSQNTLATSQEIDLAQSAIASAPKKKRIVKKKKYAEVEIQTEESVQANNNDNGQEIHEHTQEDQVNQISIVVACKLKQLNQDAQIIEKRQIIIEDKSIQEMEILEQAPEPVQGKGQMFEGGSPQGSPKLTASHIEEDSYTAVRHEESVEKRVQFRNDPPDMAHRAPVPGAPRFGAPRPGFAGGAGPQNMRGRGMPGFQARPLNPAGRGTAPSFRPSVQNAQPQIQQQQPTQLSEDLQTPRDDMQTLQGHSMLPITSSAQEERKDLNTIEEEKVQQSHQNPRFMQKPQTQIEENKESKREEIAQDMPRQLQNQNSAQNSSIQQEQMISKEEEKTRSQPQQPEEKKVKQPETVEPVKALPTPNLPGQQQQASFLGLGNNRLVGMINGLLSMLTRKKAYTGRPASAMRWDEKKKRYIIDGEDESDDDIPPPPPPVGNKIVNQNQSNGAQGSTASSAQITENKAPVQAAEASSANDLTRPAMPSHFGARGRGRGAARGGASLNRFPPAFAPSQITESQKPENSEPADNVPISNTSESLLTSRVQQQQNLVEEEKISTNNGSITSQVKVLDQSTNGDKEEVEGREEQSVLYTTTLDITMNQTHLMRESLQILPNGQQQVEQIQEVQVQEPVFDEAREQLWQDKFSSQQDKINNLKYKLQMLQQELRMQREENEQTIESFTNLCQDLKFKGMDEVEDLQSEMSIIREHLRRVTQAKAELEVRNVQSKDALSWFERENEDLRNRLQGQISKVFDLQQQLETKEAELRLATLQNENQMVLDEHVSHEQAQLVLELQSELSSLKWQKSVAEVERLNKQLEAREMHQQMEALRAKIRESDSDKQTFMEEQRRNLNDVLIQHQDQVSKLEREKDTLREMIQRVQAEKERLSDQQRDRFSDYDGKLKQVEESRAKTEQEAAKALREKDVALESLKNKLTMLSQNTQLKETEINQQKELISRLEGKVQQLMQKRQVESEMADNVMKSQLKQIQELLQQKTQEVQIYESKQSEYTQELQNMDSLRHKLTENIIYLQNEIRKRDELLESSDFGDFDYVGGADDEQSDSVIGGEDDDRASQSLAQSVRGLDGQEEDAAVGGAAIAQGLNTTPSVRNQIQQIRKRKRRTLGQQLQNQIDETRNQLKQQIEEKMRAQRAFYNLERNYQKLGESLQDINQLLDQQQQNQGVASVNNEQSSMAVAAEEETKSATHNQDLNSSYMMRNEDSLIQRSAQMDELQHQVIQKIFTLSRHFESELSEQQHKLKLMQMKLDESETLKFDLEFLTEEKALNEQEIQQFRLTVKDLEYKISELKSQIDMKTACEEDLRQQMIQERQKQNSQRQQEREQYERQLRELQADNQAKIEEIHQTFKQQLLPQIKAKHEAKYQQMQEQLIQVREQLSSQLQEQKLLNETLEESQKSLLNQTLLQQENEQEEKQRLVDRISYLEISIQESKNQINSQKNSFERVIAQLEEERETLRQEKELNEQEFNQFKESLESHYKEAALKLKEKYDAEKRKNKELKSKFKEQLELTLTQQQEEFSTSFNAEKETYESQLVALQTEMEQLKQRHQEEREHLSQTVSSLQSQVSQLQHEVQTSSQTDASLEATLLEAQANQESLQKYLSLAEQRIVSLEAEKESLKSETKEEKESLIKTIGDLQTQIQELNQRLNYLIEKDQESENAIQALNEQLVQLTEKQIDNQASQEEQTNAESSQELEKLRNEIEVLEKQKNEEVQNVQNIARTVKQQLTEQNQTLQQEISELTDQIQKLQSKSQEMDGEKKDEPVSERDNSEILKIQEQLENLKASNTELEAQHSQLVEQLNLKISQITELKSENERLQSQEEELKSANLQITQLQESIEEARQQLQNEIERKQNDDTLVSKEELEAALSRLQNQWEEKVKAKESEHQQEVQDLLQYYNSREEELKSQAVAAAEKLKSDIKKQKEKVKSVLLALEQVQNKREESQSKNKEYDTQLSEAKLKIEQIESNSKNLHLQIEELSQNIQAEKQKQQDLLNSLENKDTQLEELKQRFEGVSQNIIQIQKQLYQLMVEHSFVDALDGEDASWESLILKIKEVLSNYAEDKRSIKALIDEKENLQLLKDQYYTEKESISQEKSILQDKYENSNAFKLQQKVQTLEEERSEMKSDFYIKINSYVQEIDSLKLKLSRYEEDGISVLEESKLGNSANQSISNQSAEKQKQASVSSSSEQKRRLTPQEANQTLLNEISRASGQMVQEDPSFMDQSKTSAIDKQRREQEMNTSANQQQKSGLFNSIASFFLTDSELN